MMVVCKRLILELLDRISESDIRILSKCDFWKLLTLVVNEFDIMSFTVATTLTFSAAYVPGPIYEEAQVDELRNFSYLDFHYSVLSHGLS